MVQSKEPWLNEPDYKRWRDGETQLQCLILRVGSTGALCGYVRLPRSLAKVMDTNGFRKDGSKSGGLKYRQSAYMTSLFCGLSVHGGLTYSGGIRTMKRGHERGVWIGFDCAHWGDFAPALEKYGVFTREVRTYRDINYVTEQVRYLAQQIKELAK